MARFIVVVVVLVAIALLANKYLLGGGDAPPADAKQAAAKADAASDDASKNEAAVEKAADEAEEGGPVPKLPPVDAKEEAAAEAVASADVETDIVQEAEVDPKDVLEDVKVVGEDVTKMLPAETVQLCDPSLTAGVPGEGDLTLEEVEKWLADPKNHVVLKPELPLGLKAGEADIKGLDENPLTRAKIELGRQLRRAHHEAGTGDGLVLPRPGGIAAASLLVAGIGLEPGHQQA